MALKDELFRWEADAREALHKDHDSSRPLSQGYELVGIIGQAEFARVFQQPLDMDRKPGGDGGVDFIIPLGFKLDVKTSRKPYNLIVEQGKATADIYVLAGCTDDATRAWLLGWEWGPNVARAPVKTFGGGFLSHYIPVEQLRPMSWIAERIMIPRRGL